MKDNEAGGVCQAVPPELLAALKERHDGYQGRNARDVLAGMEQAIAVIKTRLKHKE